MDDQADVATSVCCPTGLGERPLLFPSLKLANIQRGDSRCADQLQIQAQLPLTLVPIRIDVEVPAHQPLEPFPLPRTSADPAINQTLPAYRRPDPLPPFRIKDTFLWNLHESLSTPEEFAIGFVRDLDLPNPQATTMTISNQIRQQLEEYAGVALHPLFQSTDSGVAPSLPPQTEPSRDTSMTPAATNAATPDSRPIITTTVTPTKEALVNDSLLNPDDAYRCLITLNINLQNKLYTDCLLYTSDAADEMD